MRLGAKIARKNKSNIGSKPSDINLDTRFITLPIHKQSKFSLTAPAGVDINITAPTAAVEHSLSTPPLFRAWIETVDTTTGEKTSRKIALPAIKDTIVFSAKSDGQKVTVSAASTAATYLPAVNLKWDGYIYIFGSRYDG